MNIHTYKNLERNKRLVEHKKVLVSSIKSSGCIKCGIKNPIVLEFDHINPSTKYIAISEMITNHNYSLFDVKSEIDKCQILCTNCHRLKTVTERGKDVLNKKISQENKELINSYKTNPCSDCNNSYEVYCMEFDHLPEYKKTFTIGMCKTLSKEKILNEIGKCEVVCANCHKLRTHARK